MNGGDIDARSEIHSASGIERNKLVDRHESRSFEPLSRLPADFFRKAGCCLYHNIRLEEPHIATCDIEALRAHILPLPPRWGPLEYGDDRIIDATPKARVEPDTPAHALEVPRIYEKPYPYRTKA
jgi:hypothetical protein